MRRIPGVLWLVALVTLLAADASQAAFGIVPDSVTIAALDAAEQPDRRAGGHPDRLRFGFELNTTSSGGADGNLKDLAIDFPAGMTGDPSAVVPCPREVFDAGPLAGQECPPSATVGSATVALAGFGEGTVPIFSVAPGPEQLAVLGFNPLAKLPLVMRLRPDDFGVTLEQADFIQAPAVTKMQIDLWGVPADHQEGPASPRRPFLTLPTRCDMPLGVTLNVRSWQQPQGWHSAQADTGAPLTDCGELGFDPKLEVRLSNPVADSPTGAELKVVLPQNEDPDGRANSHLRTLKLEMPDGMSISPAGAASLTACADDQLGIGTQAEARCPLSSRAGSVEMIGSGLRAPLAGSIFVGRELPGDRFRLFLVAKGSGVEVKLLGSVRVDPQSGRLTTELANLPQVPVDSIAMRFDGGPKALLSTPLKCGTVSAEAVFEPYSGGPPMHSADVVAIDRAQGQPNCGGQLPFAPEFEAGSTTAKVGRATAFSVTLRRKDGEEAAGRFSVSFPPGLSAALSSLEPCEAAAARQSTCPATSRIGSAVAELGPGPVLVPLPGDAYLTGPYRGAPFGLALAFRASLGPFDFGKVAVRAALRIDPHTGRIRVETDPLPQLVEGIPFRFRTIGLDIDKPGFLRNPTSCKPTEVSGTAVSTSGALSQSASPFFLRGCDGLGFRPRVAIAITDRGELHSHGKPGLRIAVRARPNDTNLRSADFQLPEMLSLDPSGLGALCSRQAAGNGNCPKSATVGFALARTSLLHEPLRGPVYAVQPHGEGLPDLWAVIRGSGIRLDIRSKAVVREGNLHAKLVGLPDLPLRRFVMRLESGEREGILSLASDPCTRSARVDSTVGLEGQDRAFRILRTQLSRQACGRNGFG